MFLLPDVPAVPPLKGSYTIAGARGTRGFSLLLSVIVLGALVGTVVVTMFLTGMTGQQGVAAFRASERAALYADACIEKALQEVRDDNQYSGSDQLTFTHGSCDVEVTAGSGQNRTIEATGVVDDTTRRVRVEISNINPEITVDSWQEVGSL